MKLDFVEIVSDTELKRKEKEVREVVRRFYPECGPVKLYRTADGRIGFQMQITLTAGDRKRLDELYRAIMKLLGEKRGRPRGIETVQTKLHLPKSIYSALKKAAEDSHATMSSVVTESLLAQFQTRHRERVLRTKMVWAERSANKR